VAQGGQARDEEELLAFVKRGYELWNEGDLSTVASMWSDDFELHTAPEWPGQGVFYGREAAVRFYKDWYRPDLMAVIAVGDIDPATIEKEIAIGHDVVKASGLYPDVK